MHLKGYSEQNYDPQNFALLDTWTFWFNQIYVFPAICFMKSLICFYIDTTTA